MAHLDPSNFIYDEPEDKDKIVFAKGIYKFRITEINSMTESKEARNPMLPIKFEFSRADGKTTTVYDNLVFTDTAKWKISQFLSCICGPGIKPGRKIDFNDADFLEWVKKQTGTARLKVEQVQGKDYDRNSIEAFIFSATDAPKSAPAPEPADDEDDAIPF